MENYVFMLLGAKLISLKDRALYYLHILVYPALEWAVYTALHKLYRYIAWSPFQSQFRKI